MAIHTIQPSFSGGEFSPSLQKRSDVQKYGTGLKKLKNFIVHPHGGVSNRPGFQFLAKSKFPNKKSRIISFEFSIDQSYALEFGDNYIRFFKDGGLILDSDDDIFEVVTPYNEEDLVNIKYVQSLDVLYLFHPKYPIQRLTRYADDNWTIDLFPVINGPFMPVLDSSDLFISSIGGSLPPVTGIWGPEYDIAVGISGSYFDASHVGSLLKINQFSQSSSYNYTVTGNTPGGIGGMPVKGTWRLTTSGTWAGFISIFKKVAINPGSSEIIQLKILSHLSSADDNLNVFGIEEDLTYLYIEMTGFGSGGTCYITLSCDAYATSGIAKITNFIDASNVEAKVISPLLVNGGNSKNVSWQEGSWSERRGYPTCGGFYQDRFVAAGTPGEPQGEWFSKTGNYVDFGVSSILEDTDAVSVNLPSRKMNAIKNLVVLSEVLNFTSAAEVGVGAVGGVFSPTTVSTNNYGYRGSSGVDPVIVGNRVIYVQAMGAVVRDLGFELQANGFSGSDVSIFSSHLFKNFKIVEMAFQQEPDSIVWCVRSDGKLLSMTYMQEQEVIAWSWHETNGVVESICSIPGDGQNDIYIVVNRFGERFIERLSKRLQSKEFIDANFLDSSLMYNGAPTSTPSGLEHLEGRVVWAFADGNVVRNLTVENGEVVLPFPASVIHVGLQYVSDFQTLSIQYALKDGTSAGRLSKVTDVTFSFLDSRGGFIGPDEDSLDEVMELKTPNLDDPKELFSGDYKQILASGYEPGGTVFLRQSDPLPMTILSVMPKIAPGG